MIPKERVPEIREIQIEMQEKFKSVPKKGEIVPYLNKKFIVYPGVFWPHEDSKLIVLKSKINPGESVLDLCTGSGVIAIFAALKGAKKVVALDINPEAIKTVRENAKMHNVEKIVNARISDMFTALEAGEKFDVITMNPPFTEHPAKDYAEKTMWDSDFQVHKEFFKHVRVHLKKGGRIYIAHSNFGNSEKMIQMAKDTGFNVKKIGENKIDELRTFYVFELKRLDE